MDLPRDASDILASLPEDVFARVCTECGEASVDVHRKGEWTCPACGEVSGRLNFD